MIEKENISAQTTSDREVVSVRMIDKPRELVFQAWTDPDHLIHWWGPSGFKNTFQEFDLRPGGNWRFIMHGPDGTDYPNHSVFVEITRPERLVFNHISAHYYHANVSFEDQAGKTKLTFRMRFETVEEYEKVKKYVIEGNEQNFDRLETELSKMV
ncbi:SRPBCC family protein [Leptospira sp. WS92.C1]